jgi:hypothetical protein
MLKRAFDGASTSPRGAGHCNNGMFLGHKKSILIVG